MRVGEIDVVLSLVNVIDDASFTDNQRACKGNRRRPLIKPSLVVSELSLFRESVCVTS